MKKILLFIFIYFKIISNENLYIYSKNNLYGFVNKDGEIKIEAKYQYVSDFKDGLALIKENNLYGYINQNNKYIVKNKYKDLGRFYEGVAFFQNKNDLYGYIDNKGNEIIKAKFIYAGDFSNNMAVVSYIPEGLLHMTYRSYIKKDGSIAMDIYENRNLISFTDEIGQIIYDYSFSAIGIDGKLIFSKEYDYFSTYYSYFSKFSESRAFLLKNEENMKKAILINKNFKQIGNVEVDYCWYYQFINGKCLVYIDSKPVLIDKKGNILKYFSYDRVTLLNNGYFIVEKNDKYGVLDDNFNVIAMLNYNYLGNSGDDNFINGLLYFEKGNQKGYIDESGKVIIDFSKLKKVISDIKFWSHPTKNIFNKYKIKINKVELIENYPIFYVNLEKNYSKNELDKIISELLKANGYWDFELKDSSTNKIIKVYGDKKNKKLIKWEYN